MAKNKDLLSALNNLMADDNAAKRQLQISAFKAISEAKNDNEIRAAFIAHQDIFGDKTAPIFKTPTQVINDDAFLVPAGEGDAAPNSIRVLQQLAAEKLVAFMLVHATDKTKQAAVLNALVNANDEATRRAALVTAEAKAIFGDLAATTHNWADLLSNTRLESIQKVASSILTSPIQKKIDELAAEIDPIIVDVTESLDHFGDNDADVIDDTKVADAIKNFGKMLAKQQELIDFRARNAGLLNLQGNAPQTALIDAAVQAADQKVIQAKTALTDQIDKLLEVVADRKAKVDASLADAEDPHADAAAIAAARKDAEKHFQAINDALELVKLTGDVAAVTPAATANKKAADALARLNAHAHASSAEASLADISAADVVFKAIAYVPPTQAKPTADDVIKARDLFDSRKADELAKLKLTFRQLKRHESKLTRSLKRILQILHSKRHWIEQMLL